MSKIVQLENRYKEKVYPVAGGALEDSITAGMIADPVPIIGEDHSATPAAQFVATGNIQGGAVTTEKLADGAVTSDKIDWATIEEVVSYNEGRQRAIKFANGLLVNIMYINYANVSFTTANGSLYNSSFLESPDYPVPFVEIYGKPLWGLTTGGWAAWIDAVQEPSELTNPGSPRFAREATATSAQVRASCVAFGRWK